MMFRYAIVCLVLMSSLHVAHAAIPEKLSYQGVLTDASGVVVPDGGYQVIFRLYDVAIGGAQLWGQASIVTTESGRFNVILGEANPLTGVAFDVPYYLGIQINGDSEMTPRTEIVASAYAFTAKTVEDDAITSGKIADGVAVRSVNGVTDDINLVAGSNVTITPNGNDIEISSSGAGADDDWTIDVPGNRIQTDKIVEVASTNPIGGTLHVLDDQGFPVANLSADVDGQGGHLTVRRSNGVTGFQVDGNYNGTLSPRVNIFGLSPMSFQPDQVGDASVNLPVGAISNSELAAEAGLAHASAGLPDGLFMGSPPKSVLSKTIIPPELGGQLLVIATLEIEVFHFPSDFEAAEIGISRLADFFTEETFTFKLDSDVPEGVYAFPVTIHESLNVHSGPNTLHLVVQNTGGGGVNPVITIRQRELTIIYIPTVYGSAGKGNPLSKLGSERNGDRSLGPANIEAEKRESIAANEARIQKELDEMRERMAKMEAEMAAQGEKR